MLVNQQSYQADETARKPESGAVVVALPALPTGQASVDLQGGALEQNLKTSTIEEETGKGRDEDLAIPWTIACCQMVRNGESTQHCTREGGVSHEDGAASTTGYVHVKLLSSCRLPPCKGAVVQVQELGIEGTREKPCWISRRTSCRNQPYPPCYKLYGRW